MTWAITTMTFAIIGANAGRFLVSNARNAGLSGQRRTRQSYYQTSAARSMDTATPARMIVLQMRPAMTDTTPAAIEALLKDVTPGSKWRVEGKPDPHGTRYDCPRSALPMADLSDDEMANGVYLFGDDHPPIADLLSGKAKTPGVWLDAAKNRIRWLSRKLDVLRDLVPAIAAERDAARNELRFYELFSDHASVVRGVIAAAGDLPTMNDGPFKEGFFSGIEEVAARADIQANDGNRQMQDLMSQIAELVQGNATLIMAPDGEYVNAIDRAEKAETEAAAWRIAIMKLTPGGSEYTNPDAVIAFVERERADRHKARAEKAKAVREAAAWRGEVARLKGLADRKKFPILGGRGVSVDWQLVADHSGQANTNHGQTVARLAERGGLSWCELFAVLHNRRWEKMDANDAMIACRALETRYLAALTSKGGEV